MWGYASVELIESHKTKDEFLRDYKIYVKLLRTLAKEAGIQIKVDAGTTGILSHEYCTYNQPNNASDHVDPYPYLAKWGISRLQFKKDVENGLEGTGKNGWVKENNVWRWYENGTAFKNGWKKVKGKWYYLDTNGIMQTGWQIIDGRYYKLDKSGAMVEGWYQEGKTWYYLDASGAMKTGWFKDKAGNWYYLSKPSGAMVTGTVPIDGKTYQFDKNGVCLNP